jgi:hypothetical protein
MNVAAMAVRAAAAIREMKMLLISVSFSQSRSRGVWVVEKRLEPSPSRILNENLEPGGPDAHGFYRPGAFDV